MKMRRVGRDVKPREAKWDLDKTSSLALVGWLIFVSFVGYFFAVPLIEVFPAAVKTLNTPVGFRSAFSLQGLLLFLTFCWCSAVVWGCKESGERISKALAKRVFGD